MTSISVILPAYQAAGYIAEALASVKAQSRAAEEIIVVDDASTDDTAEHAEAADGVQVIRQPENRGPGACRNRGAAGACGDYLAFLDADDLWQPGHLESLGDLLDRFPEAGLAFSRLEEIGARSGIFPQDAGECPTRPEKRFLQAMRNIFILPSCTVIRRSAFEQLGGYRDFHAFYRGKRVQGEDFDFVTRVCLFFPVVATPEVTACHRWHAGQSSEHVAPQRIMHFRYRLDILSRMESGEYPGEDLAAARDRTRQSWEQWLEWHWRHRDARGLREMVDFGRQHELLADAARSYAGKARLPGWAVRCRDILKRREQPA